jgi:Kdo2-lipid IVA lauroyltransferase/acyltransferase
MRFQLERLAFWMVLQAARLIPRKLFLSIGESLGAVAFVLDRRHTKVGLENYATAFPGSTAEDAKKTVKASYVFFGRYLFDILTCFRGFPESRLKDFEFEGLDHLEGAYSQNKGVLLYGAHWGAWELHALVHGAKGYPLALLVRRLDNPYLESLLEKFRTILGNSVIEKREGIRGTLSALKKGKAVAILMDQNITTEERIFVNFFGKPASTTPVVGLLHLKTEAPLVSVFALPLPGGRYRLCYGAPVKVPLTGDRAIDVERVTQECTRMIEEQIRKYPDYWLWMHRRWKTRPDLTVRDIDVESAENVVKA